MALLCFSGSQNNDTVHFEQLEMRIVSAGAQCAGVQFIRIDCARTERDGHSGRPDIKQEAHHE